MFRRRTSSPSSSIIAALSLGLVAAPLALVASPAAATPAAAPDGSGLVISEVYGAGGNANAVYDADYVELFNPTDAAIDLAGLSVQYRSTSGNPGAPAAPLTGSVDAGSHFLIQMGASGANGAALPTPDVGPLGFNLSGSNGQALLINGTEFTGSGDVAGNTGLVDMVGYGTGNNTFEGATSGVSLSAATAASRNADGTDTDNNADDFSEPAPDPQNSGGAEPPPPPPDPTEVTIAEVQGTGDTSPLEGETVTTQGVVIASYATGGFDGFYIQTEGTGASDDTPGASDAVFVYGRNIDESTLTTGDDVQVTGPVSEFRGTTQITPDEGGVTPVEGDPDPVTPRDFQLPGTEVGREAHEGELIMPEGPLTVTNTFSLNGFGEIGLAVGEQPLVQPTEVADAQDPDAVAEVEARNARRAVSLDDGASINFLSQADKRIPLPYLATDRPIRVGAAVTFTAPVVLEYRFNTWRFQPTERLESGDTPPAEFDDTRTPAPEDVGGDVRLATFNVLNYFTTTAEEFVDAGGSCTYYTDRFGNPITADRCEPDGPRGAANDANLARQQDKIVAAINALDAGIVGLEELENSAKFDQDRDTALSTLVDALNADLGSDDWAFAPSPEVRPTPAEEDVIRTAFIYKSAEVEPVGDSAILLDETNFSNAREPLAQAFRTVGGDDDDAFAVIVNHLKSKSDSSPPATGDNADGVQGAFNGDRVRQAGALSDFADTFAAERGTESVFLIGDFNAYSEEDPIQALEADGYTALESDTPDEETYSFRGLSGSLDHVLANDAALELVTGSDVWGINSGESVALEYSRYNYNATNFYAPDAYRASDHDPYVVGLDLPGVGPEEIQILGTNDFHGRLINNTRGGEAGAAILSGAVKQLRAENPNTIFAAAGDLIGASTFESFIQRDKPTIDALNEAGLDVSAVGNHEFDRGYDDLMNRVIAPYDADTNPEGGARWKYLGANVKVREGRDATPLDAVWSEELDGVQVGFIGAVTESLPTLVSPTGIEDIEVTDIVEASNEAATDLEAAGADVIVLLVHEGAPGTDCATMDDPTSDFGSIVTGVNDDIDAIVSGHTHLEYNCSFPVAGWADRAVTERPVVSAGQYGIALNQLVFTVESSTGEVTDLEQNVLRLKSGPTTPNYPSDPLVASIVQDAVDRAAVLGAQPLGVIGGEFSRAKLANGTTENRGGESTVGNLVAEVQRWATESPTTGEAQIAFMNPGGLRAEMADAAGEYPSTLTYRQAANVQPFANTLVNMDLTGAQIESVLEEQWQPEGADRPFLRLGISEGFTYSYTPPPAGSPSGTAGEVTGMWLDGVRVDDATTYSVTVNSFLAGGGDGFATLTEGASPQDTGQTDLEAMVNYMAEFAEEEPLPVDYSQRSVGTVFPADAPATYEPGETVEVDLTSLSMTGPNDVHDEAVAVSLDGDELGSFPVETTVQTALPGFDEVGVASLSVVLPADVADGVAELVVTGDQTGTEVMVPVQVEGEQPPPPPPTQVEPTIKIKVKPGKIKAGKTRPRVVAIVRGDGEAATGRVRIKVSGKPARSVLLRNGRAKVRFPSFNKAGRNTARVVYLGSDTIRRGSEKVTFRVVRR